MWKLLEAKQAESGKWSRRTKVAQKSEATNTIGYEDVAGEVQGS